MGPMNQILSLMPGLNKKAMKNFNMDDRQISWTEAIISSMTIIGKYPEKINGSRRLRIAKVVEEQYKRLFLLKNFFQLKK